jgi:serine/threonine protein kinase
MLTGTSPFFIAQDTSLDDQFRQLMTTEVCMPPYLSAAAKDLLEKLLVKSVSARQPTKRLRDIETIKRHPFFEQINWSRLKSLKVVPPREVVVEDITRTDVVFSAEDSEESFDNVVMSDERKKALKVINFTFIRNDSSATSTRLRGSSGSVAVPNKFDDTRSGESPGTSSRLSIA